MWLALLLGLWIGFAAGFACAAIFAGTSSRRAREDERRLSQRIEAYDRRLPVDHRAG